MKKIDQKDLLASAQRFSFSSSAKAAEVIRTAEKYFNENLQKNVSYKVRCFKGGTLFVYTEHAAGSQAVYSLSDGLLQHLQEQFPAYRFRSVRMEIETSLSHRC